MNNAHFSSLRRSAAFTLIEMIAVISIIAIITVFVVPAATTILKGSQLTQASTIITDQISLARQQALTKNCMVEVRFVRFGDPEQPGEKASTPMTGKFRALEVMQVLPSGVSVPLGKVQILPTSIMMAFTEGQTATGNSNSNFSTLLSTGSGTAPLYTTTPPNTDPDLPRGIKKSYNYYSFRFLPDGSTNLLPTVQWYVTLINRNDEAKLSGTGIQSINFFTLQLDPVSGATRSYRPTAK